MHWISSDKWKWSVLPMHTTTDAYRQSKRLPIWKALNVFQRLSNSKSPHRVTTNYAKSASWLLSVWHPCLHVVQWLMVSQWHFLASKWLRWQIVCLRFGSSRFDSASVRSTFDLAIWQWNRHWAWYWNPCHSLWECLLCQLQLIHKLVYPLRVAQTWCSLRAHRFAFFLRLRTFWRDVMTCHLGKWVMKAKRPTKLATTIYVMALFIT